DAMRVAFPEIGRGPVAMTIEKNMPVASGMGGGSSDAAATIRALTRLWGVTEREQELQRLAATLGADVPMCLTARPLMARGIGESLEPVARFPKLHLVLANPGVAVSTQQVFQALTKRDNPPPPPLPR